MYIYKQFFCLIFVKCLILRIHSEQVAVNPTISHINEKATNKYHQPLKPRPSLSTSILSYKIATTEIPKYVAQIQLRNANKGNTIKQSIVSGKYKDIYTQNSFKQNFNLRYNNNNPYGKNNYESKEIFNVDDNSLNNNGNILSSRRNINGGPNFDTNLKTKLSQRQSINNPFLPLYNHYKEHEKQESMGIDTPECVEKNGQLDEDIQPADVLNSKGVTDKINENFSYEYSEAQFPIVPKPQDHFNMFYITDNGLIGNLYRRNNDYSNSRRSNDVNRKLFRHNNIGKHRSDYLNGINENDKVDLYQESADALGKTTTNLMYRPLFDVKNFSDYGELDPRKLTLDFQNHGQDHHSTQLNGLYYPRTFQFQPFQQSRPFQQYVSGYQPNLARYNIQTSNNIENLRPTHLQQLPDKLIQRSQIAVPKSYIPAQEFAIDNNYQLAQDYKKNNEFENYCRNLLYHYLHLLLTKDDSIFLQPTNNDISKRLFRKSTKNPNTVASTDSTISLTEIPTTTTKLTNSLPSATTSEEDQIHQVKMAKDKILPRRLRCYACNNDTNSQCNRQNRFNKTEKCLEENDVCTKIVTRNRYTGRKTLYRRCGTRNSCHTVNTMYADVESCSWCGTNLCNAAAISFTFQNIIAFVAISIIVTIRRF